MRNKTKQLLEENNQAEKALSQEGQKLLTDLVVYLRGSRASVWEQEQVRRDITQMLLDAEKRGEKAESVIGSDPKSFCDEVIGELPVMPGWKRNLSTLRDGLLAAVILLVIWFASSALQGALGVGSWPELTLSWGQFLSGGGILVTACGLVHWICRDSFEAEEKNGPWLLMFLVLFGLLCLGVFLRQPLVVLSLPAAVGLIAALFILYKILDLRLD